VGDDGARVQIRQRLLCVRVRCAKDDDTRTKKEMGITSLESAQCQIVFSNFGVWNSSASKEVCAFAKSMGINYTRGRRRGCGNTKDVESRTVARLSDSHDATIGDAFTSAVAIDDGVASGEFAAAL